MVNNSLKSHIANWFTYHPPKGDQAERYTRLRAAAGKFAIEIIDLAPASEDLFAAIRHVREAVFTANAAIACTPSEFCPPLPAPVPTDGLGSALPSDEDIARIAHEANRAICEAVNDRSQKPWDETPDNIRASTLGIVRECRSDPNYSPVTSHNRWLDDRERDGWVWGEVKDNFRKTNPAMVPFDVLPVEQRIKAFVFVGIVRAMLPNVPKAPGTDA